MLANGPDLVLGLGDYSYEENADCWINVVEPIVAKMKIAMGNHDDTSPNIADQYMSYFNLTKQYYSFDYQDVHFIAMSTELPFMIGSEQHEFVKSNLARSAADPDIHWIIVYFHKPAYTSPTKHMAVAELAETYHSLFVHYEVDLVLQGHNHNHQRTFPINYNITSASNPIITDRSPIEYVDPKGPIFVTVGTGGRSLYSLDGKAYFTA